MIDVKGLTRHYEGRPVIADLTFSVPRGQVLGLLGASGAGKSTTLRILTGYLGATSGTASVADRDVVAQSREARRRLGYAPQTVALYPEMRVASYLDAMCRLRGVRPGVRRFRVDQALATCGLADRRREIIGRLPGIARRRLGLAQAVVHDPEVLLLDDPAAGLDAEQAGETRDLVAELGRQRTVVLASRALADASAVCDRALVLRQGRVVADDAPAELGRRLGQGQREVVALVRGDPAGVERHVRSIDGAAKVALADLGDGDHRLTVTGDREDLQDAVARVIVEHGFRLKELSSRAARSDDALLDLLTEDSS
ncbi:MAG TPA: ABC transporter ATP-binding protein [Candidatus Dormibacteraeota bacterium]